MGTGAEAELGVGVGGVTKCDSTRASTLSATAGFPRTARSMPSTPSKEML